MKLILTSKDFLNDKSKKIIIDNLDKPISLCKVLFIPSKWKLLGEENINKYLTRLEYDGFNKDNCYILDYNNVQNYKDLNVDVIYVGGGNTFELLNNLRKSRFDKILIKYIKNNVTYVGGSAGTHIITKNIKHVLDFDDNLVKLRNFNALGIFDGIIFCHYTDEREKYFLKSKNAHKFKTYKLKDEEAIIIYSNGKKIEFIFFKSN